MKLRSLLYIALLAIGSTWAVSCSEDDLNPNSVFPDVEESIDPNSYTFQLDSFLKREYLANYNVDYRFKLQDVGADMNYNLSPARYDAAVDLAVLTKYMWFEVYDKLAGKDFLKTYGPRIIHLIGTPAVNASSGTIILGLAEGGLKVSLFRVNSIDPYNPDSLNSYYFHTMHHEFAHILHQTKTYPAEFKLLSNSFYDPMRWQYRDSGVVNSFGCVTPYGSSQEREDFVEVVATYITSTDYQWNYILERAARNYEESGQEDRYGNPLYHSPDDIQDNMGGMLDGVAGAAVINQKVQIIRTWFRDAWNIDLDALRAEILYRQANVVDKLDSLRSQVYSIERPTTTTQQ